QAYTGAHFSTDEVEVILRQQGIVYERLTDDELFETTATLLADGMVVGWFQGRAELGPRALGNRSILANPARQDARDLINSKIKRRESFRPFAPSILDEAVGEYFEKTDTAPFMEKVLRIREEQRNNIPAVTHIDGTGRLQTVSAIDNPRYHRVIQRFADKTGVPLLLNTSFNENEPIVNTPDEALACYLRTDMDVLVLENCLIRRL
ncbi:MAG: carbamoyltransferase C-terminal domain-containing protein, partial [Saprospiraceae bacterium]